MCYVLKIRFNFRSLMTLQHCYTFSVSANVVFSPTMSWFVFSSSLFIYVCLSVSSHRFLTTFVFDMLPFCLSFCFSSPKKLMSWAHLRDQGCVRTYLSHYHLITILMSSLFIYLHVSLHIMSSLLYSIK